MVQILLRHNEMSAQAGLIDQNRNVPTQNASGPY